MSTLLLARGAEAGGLTAPSFAGAGLDARLGLDRPTVAAPSDPILLHAFARRGRPLAVSDLLRAMTGTGSRLSEVMELLAEGLRAGLLAPRGHRADEHGALVGPLLYELTDEGRAFVEADRLL